MPTTTAQESRSQCILVVDGDHSHREQLDRYFTSHGFRVVSTNEANAAEQRLQKGGVDLIILDMAIPGEDSLGLVRRIRAVADYPLIMTSACCDEMDRIVGLELGADDYLQKPINSRELLARIRAVLRRYNIPMREQGGSGPVSFNFGPFSLDTLSRVLMRHGREVPLTPGEFALLTVFVRNPHRPLSRDELMELTKGYDRSPLDRSVDMLVARLRRKIEPDSTDPKYIRTLWGTGYFFAPPEKADGNSLARLLPLSSLCVIPAAVSVLHSMPSV